jgi:hypothetical protein
MKEATGELNMTVVTVVAIAAVGAFFYAFVWPTVKSSIRDKTCDAQCENGGTYTEEKTDKNGDVITEGGCTCN